MENNGELSDLNDKLIDLELAKNDNNKPVRKFLPAIVLAASFYYSFLLALGLALGYFGSKIFHKIGAKFSGMSFKNKNKLPNGWRGVI